MRVLVAVDRTDLSISTLKMFLETQAKITHEVIVLYLSEEPSKATERRRESLINEQNVEGSNLLTKAMETKTHAKSTEVIFGQTKLSNHPEMLGEIIEIIEERSVELVVMGIRGILRLRKFINTVAEFNQASKLVKYTRPKKADRG